MILWWIIKEIKSCGFIKPNQEFDYATSEGTTFFGLKVSLAVTNEVFAMHKTIEKSDLKHKQIRAITLSRGCIKACRACKEFLHLTLCGIYQMITVRQVRLCKKIQHCTP